MLKAQQLHTAAMKSADAALQATRIGNVVSARASFKKAFELEAQAAQFTKQQPSRAVLFRSAANLAIEAGDYDGAELMACYGLISGPPEDISEELRHANDRATFMRHLKLQGVTLSTAAVQLTVAGPSVGPGDAPEPEVMSRIDSYRKLISRSANRKRGIRYSDSPAVQNADYQLFISTPRVASFAVTLRVGSREMQNHLAFDVSPDSVVEDIFKNLSHFESNRESDLRDAIPDTDYRRNFVALAKRLAPDGGRITTVGLTRQTPSGTEELALRQPRSEHLISRRPRDAGTTSLLEGRLELADTRGTKKSGRIILVAGDTAHNIAVPKGMLADIVRPHFGELVTLRVRRRSGRAYIFVEFVDNRK